MTGHLLMVTRRSPSGDAEAEPVTVEVTSFSVRITLDDGEVVVFDRDELAAAVAGEAQEAEAA